MDQHTTLQQFLTTLFPNPADLIELRVLPSRDRALATPDMTQDITAFIERHASEEVYFGCATRLEQAGEIKGGANQCGTVRALWADIDFKNTEESAARFLLSVTPTPPSIIVNSGGGLHCYWLLKDTVPADDTVKSWLRRLVATFMGDERAAEVARILRVPGTLNHKYDPPRRVEIEVFDPTRQYSFSDLEHLNPERVKSQELKESRRSELAVDAAPEAISQAARVIAPFWPANGSRHEFSLALGGWLARQGFSQETVKSVVHEAATIAGDEDESSTGDRSKAASDAVTAVESEQHAFGMPKLCELVPHIPPILDAALALLHGPRNAIDSSEVDNTPERAPELPDSAMIGLAREFTDLYSEHFEAPRVFWYFSFLTFLGATISKKVALDGGTNEPPRLYTTLLGTSGWTRKSSAMDATEDFFTNMSDAMYGKSYSAADASPESLLVLHGSGSAEALAKRVASDQKRPILMKFDELKMLVDKGRADGSQLLPLLTNVWGKGRWSNTTLTYTVDLTEAAVSILAACTLGTFDSAFRGSEHDIGLLNRIWLVPGQLERVVAIPSAPDEDKVRRLTGKVQVAIRSLAQSGGRATFALEARKLWQSWYTDFRRRIADRSSATRVDSYGLRLCVLLAACEPQHVPGQLVISTRVVQAVIEMLEWQLVVREQYYPIIADTAAAAMEEKIRKALARRPGLWVTRKRLIDYVNARRSGTQTLDKALDGLVRNAEIEVRSEPHKNSKNTCRWYRVVADSPETQ